MKNLSFIFLIVSICGCQSIKTQNNKQITFNLDEYAQGFLNSTNPTDEAYGYTLRFAEVIHNRADLLDNMILTEKADDILKSEDKQK